MVVPSRTGLSAAVAAAVVLSAPVLLGGGLKAEERINWLKTPAAEVQPTTAAGAAAAAIPAQPASADLPLPPGSWGSAGDLGVQDRGLRG